MASSSWLDFCRAMSPEEYREVWGELQTFIDGMLTWMPGSSFSFQKLYLAVYKCCFLLEHERLYYDLRQHVKTRPRRYIKEILKQTRTKPSHNLFDIWEHSSVSGCSVAVFIQ